MKKFKLPPSLFSILVWAGLTTLMVFLGFEASLMTKSATYVDNSQLEKFATQGELHLLTTKDENLLYFSQNGENYSTLHSDEVISSLKFATAETIQNHLFYQLAALLFFLLLLKSLANAFGFRRPVEINGPQGQGKQLHNTMSDISSFKTPLPETGLEGVPGLLPETQEELRIVVESVQMNNSENPQQFGMAKPINGLLLHGPPGTGKTLLAKSLAKELNAGYYELSGSSFNEMYIGVGSSRVRNLFKDALENSKDRPQVVFIDEIDALAKARTGGVSSNSEETLNELLVQMTKIRGSNVLAIFATNFERQLDEAFLRPGRIDYKIEIPTPDFEGRNELIAFMAKRYDAEHMLEQSEEISSKTFGFSGADLEDVFNKASRQAYRDQTPITMEHIEQAIERQQLGTKGRIQISGTRKERVAFHEAGHALLQLLHFPNTVDVATIAPHSGSLGLVKTTWSEDNMLMTRSELLNRITMILGGAAAEISHYGDDHSAGVSGDFKTAKDLASRMVKEMGMTLEGINFFTDEKQQNEEISKILTTCLQKAQEEIKVHKDKFNRISDLLLAKETIRKSEINEVMEEI